NGITDYSVVNPEFDTTLKTPFSKIAKVQKETKIPAKSTVVVNVNIEMPTESYDGVILGGLYFKEKEDEEDKKKSEGVQIKNKYAYAIGVVLRARNVVTANLQNIKPAMLKNLSVDAKVYTEKGKDI
ncbi:WxL protein peptidoglycan domain-containing protein, partial [Bacillus cereus]|uniref:WxL protein peptidoglycan domain-containing protein n=1 Tax=Bacillus cereus TaxID=1396 RepID=UPI002842C6E6